MATYTYNGRNQIASHVVESGLFTATRCTGIIRSGDTLVPTSATYAHDNARQVTRTALPITSGTQNNTYAYDGNGSITAWVNATGTVIARQRYDAFGQIIKQMGNPPSNDGFSTKPQEKVTGLLYYGYRYYDPITGCWPSRDPIGENGGVNLYGFIENSTLGWFDILGKQGCPPNGLPYDPQNWNNPQSVLEFNCYDYASNRKRGYFTKPGEPSGEKYADKKNINCDTLLRSAIKDNEGKPVNEKGCCPTGYHKIVLVLSEDKLEGKRDFHWLRQDDNGRWSHKDGEKPATNLDASRKEIIDPYTADLDYKAPGKGGGHNYPQDQRCKTGICVPN